MIDLQNRAKYGEAAPRFAERIYIEPQSCQGMTLTKKRTLGWGPHNSGKVITSWPLKDEDIVPLTSLTKIKFCIDHWTNGVAWDHTGAYEFHEAEGKKIDDIVRKYKRLDQIFDTVRSDGRLKTMQELNPHHFRETDGIRINIGPGRQLVFADGGTHRLAMAIVLALPVVPAQIGCLYSGALSKLAGLRANLSKGERGSPTKLPKFRI